MKRLSERAIKYCIATAAYFNALQRSRRDDVVFGVCGGLAENSPVSSWIFRVVFIASIFLYGLGIFLYIAMAVIIPLQPSSRKDKTEKAIEHLESKGFIVLPKKTAKAIGLDGTKECSNVT